MSIIALSKGQVECGKTVKDSKRRYYWLFKLDDTDHKLELIISFLTGKRKVILDQKVIYEQKSLLNIKFDFRHNIGYHNLQVSQQLKQFTLRINNEPFQSLLMNNVKFNLGIDKSKQINQAQQKKQTSNNPFSEFQTLCSSSPPKAVTSNAFEQFDMNFKYTPSSQPQQQTSELNFVNSNQQNKSINILAFENNFKQFDDFTQDQMFNTNAYIPGAQIYSGNSFEPKVEKSSSPLKAIVTKLQFGSFYEKPQYIPNSNNPFVNNNINTNMNINMNMNMNFNNPNTIQTTIKPNNNNNNNNNNSNNNNNNNLLDLDLL